MISRNSQTHHDNFDEDPIEYTIQSIHGVYEPTLVNATIQDNQIAITRKTAPKKKEIKPKIKWPADISEIELGVNRVKFDLSPERICSVPFGVELTYSLNKKISSDLIKIISKVSNKNPNNLNDSDREKIHFTIDRIFESIIEGHINFNSLKNEIDDLIAPLQTYSVNEDPGSIEISTCVCDEKNQKKWLSSIDKIDKLMTSRGFEPSSSADEENDGGGHINLEFSEYHYCDETAKNSLIFGKFGIHTYLNICKFLIDYPALSWALKAINNDLISLYSYLDYGVFELFKSKYIRHLPGNSGCPVKLNYHGSVIVLEFRMFKMHRNKTELLENIKIADKIYQFAINQAIKRGPVSFKLKKAEVKKFITSLQNNKKEAIKNLKESLNCIGIKDKSIEARLIESLENKFELEDSCRNKILK